MKRIAPVLAVLFALGIVAAPASAQSNPAEGTWKLLYRVMPDGAKVMLPQIVGLGSLIKGNRNLNVMWPGSDGKPSSYSLVSTYKFSGNEYTETLSYSLFIDSASGQGPVYNQNRETKSVPIKRSGNRVEYKLPFDLPYIVIDGDTLTATAEGAFVDYWERVK